MGKMGGKVRVSMAQMGGNVHEIMAHYTSVKFFKLMRTTFWPVELPAKD